MKELRCTLICDGPSDVALIPVLTWLLHEHCPDYFAPLVWADLARLKQPPRRLPEKIAKAVEWYTCELLFVHRDAERDPRDSRVREIQQAVLEAERASAVPPAVCVIPVRMQEAWLLFDESAIRSAAGNPSGTSPLGLPDMARLEDEPDPKRLLNEAIRGASALSSRRLRNLDVPARAQRVAEYTTDFAPLRRLSAFAALEAELRALVAARGWQAT